MLKAFPSKAAGALAMLSSMLILFTLPWLDALCGELGSLVADPDYKLGFESSFLAFILNVFFLGWLGGLAVDEVNQVFMQLGTLYYFGYFLVLVPWFSYIQARFLIYLNRAKLELEEELEEYRALFQGKYNASEVGVKDEDLSEKGVVFLNDATVWGAAKE